MRNKAEGLWLESIICGGICQAGEAPLPSAILTGPSSSWRRVCAQGTDASTYLRTMTGKEYHNETTSRRLATG